MGESTPRLMFLLLVATKGRFPFLFFPFDFIFSFWGLISLQHKVSNVMKWITLRNSFREGEETLSIILQGKVSTPSWPSSSASPQVTGMRIEHELGTDKWMKQFHFLRHFLILCLHNEYQRRACHSTLLSQNCRTRLTGIMNLKWHDLCRARRVPTIAGLIWKHYSPEGNM